ncbi:MAG: hypothetical protein Q9188_005981 [Gyalolechia gomerana]
MHLSFLIFFALIGLSTSALLSQRSQGSNRSLASFESPSQLLHRVCRWTTLCKTQRACAHVVEEARGGRHNLLRPEVDASAKELNVSQDIPSYVFDFAPLVHLYSGEKFWPCDIAEHLEHVTPYLNYTQMRATSSNLNLTNLDQLNEYERGRSVYLKSNDNVEARPDWLGGEKNIPNDPEDMQERPSEDRKHLQRPLSTGGTAQLHGGRSDAPAVLVVIDKGNGIIDAFWFFFYSYNLGNLVFNVRFGNHVGDWEHTLIRFHHGKPKYLFLSEHFFGQAYTYDAVEKLGKRVS